MLAPQMLNIGLELRSEGTVVVETGDTAVDFETGCEEELLLEEVLTLLALVLLGKILASLGCSHLGTLN